MRARAYITYVCACARARMTERVSALKGHKIAENISQSRAKNCQKSFLNWLKTPMYQRFTAFYGRGFCIFLLL